MAAVETASESSALLLGMVFSKEVPPSRGQMFRDRARCLAMETLGFTVSTLDDKHDASLAEEKKHCRSNFANGQRMWRNILSEWSLGGKEDTSSLICYDDIILDYFFSPAGWVNTRWTERFFSETLPLVVKKGLLKKNGSVWLPHLHHVEVMLDTHAKILSKYYSCAIVKDPNENPLYRATDGVKEELMKCPDNLTNETQILPLLEFPDGPFYKLSPKEDAEESTTAQFQIKKPIIRAKQRKKRSLDSTTKKSTSSKKKNKTKS